MGMFDVQDNGKSVQDNGKSVQDNGKSVQDILDELNRGSTQRIQDWLDRGGGSLALTLVLIIISTYHIIMVLAHRDPLVVAVSVAVVCDWGLFNFVSFLLKERFSKSKAEIPAAAFTFLLAGAAAFYSVMFHLRYYNGDWFLALFTPFSIVLLSWTSYRQRKRWDQKQKSDERSQDFKEKQKQERDKGMKIAEAITNVAFAVNKGMKEPKAESRTKTLSSLLLVDPGTGEVACPVCGKRARSAKALQGAGHSIKECLNKEKNNENI